MYLLNAIIAFGAIAAASAGGGGGKPLAPISPGCNKIRPYFTIGAESDEGGRLYYKRVKVDKLSVPKYTTEDEKYWNNIRRGNEMTTTRFDSPGTGYGTNYWYKDWKSTKIGFTLFNRGQDKIIITSWKINKCSKQLGVFGCQKENTITDMRWSDSKGYWCLSSKPDQKHHGKPCYPGITIYPGNHYGFPKPALPWFGWLWRWQWYPVEVDIADSSSVSEVALLPAETDEETDEMDMENKHNLDSISSECKSNEYSMALNVISDPGLHFVLSASSNTNDVEGNCPDDIFLVSGDGEKTVLFQTTEEVAELSAKLNVVAFPLGNVTLADIIEAEANVEPFDYETNYDLTQNSCFHYAQRITRYLQLDETVALGDFLVQNLLRNDALLEMAETHSAKGGLRVMSKFVSKDVFENYVKDLVFSQLDIADEKIKIVPEDAEDVSVVVA